MNLLVHLSDGYVFWYQGVPRRVLVVGLSKHSRAYLHTALPSVCVRGRTRRGERVSIRGSRLQVTRVYERESERDDRTLRRKFCNVFLVNLRPLPGARSTAYVCDLVLAVFRENRNTTTRRKAPPNVRDYGEPTDGPL